MKEWIVCADNPTRAMERMKTGEVVRCRDCTFSMSMGFKCKLFHDRYDSNAQVAPEGFCAWGEADE